jgi:hypothetical protein
VLKVSQVQRTNAASNAIAIRTDDRLGGRRTITASSWQHDQIEVSGYVPIAIESLRSTPMVRLAR